MTKARIVKRTTDDGTFSVAAEIPLGREVYVDLDKALEIARELLEVLDS